jgi:prepilin-type N-terminal cleavage/methylation domain-containing protein
MSTVKPIKTSGGFSLIEAAVAIVVLGIAATIITSLQGNIFSGVDAEKNLQASSLTQQRCAETLMGLRKSKGYAGATGNVCSAITTPTGAALSVSVINLTGSDSTSACPLGQVCRRFEIAAPGAQPLILQLHEYDLD